MQIVDKMLIFIPVLFISGTVVDAETCNLKLDTLYHYYMGYYEQHLTTGVLSNEDELISFLQKTGYNKERAMKTTAVTQDFSKKTVFVFAGWPCTVINILEDSTEITLQYREEYRRTGTDDGVEYARPANIAVIYAIPRTGKSIAFIDITRKQ